ncbi:MAG: hypothetical protein JW920_04295 [Deltaproteobacteria bacterium]|nr:hypothetical protein [Deltaproteobacteria bacterium]
MNSNDHTSIKKLRKKISVVEVVIILLLVLVWLATWYLITQSKQKHIDTMITLQENILSMTVNHYGTSAPGETLQISWPFENGYHLFIIRDNRVLYSSDNLIQKGAGLNEAFGKALNSQNLIKHMSVSNSGTDWIKRDSLSQQQWITWLASPETHEVFGILADETYLFNLSGFIRFRFIMMVCAGLASAVLLLFLIWALSWMRLSAIKGLRD